MKCSKCGERESTGFFFTLCDPCFDIADDDLRARRERTGAPVVISDLEFTELFGDAPQKDGN